MRGRGTQLKRWMAVIFTVFLVFNALFSGRAAASETGGKTLSVGAGQTYTTIQEAVDYIDGQIDKEGWTINAGSGTYDGFNIPAGLDGLNIVAADNAVINISSTMTVNSTVTLDGFTVNSSVDGNWTTAAAILVSDASVSLTVQNCTFTGSGAASVSGYALLITACDVLTVQSCSFDGFYMVMDLYTCTSVTVDKNTVQNCDIFVHGGGFGEGCQNVDLTVTDNSITGTADKTCASLVGDCSKYVYDVGLEKSTGIGTLTLSGNTFTYAYFGLQGSDAISMEDYLTSNTYDHGYLVSEIVYYNSSTYGTENGYYYGESTLMTVLPADAYAAVWSVNSDLYPNQKTATEMPDGRTVDSITFSGYGTAVGYGYTTFSLDYIEAGSLTVSKTVDGGDSGKKFSFAVTIDADTVDGAKDFSLTGTYGDVELADGVGTFTLADGESVTISGLPVGATYLVTESSVAGYTSSVSGGNAEGTIEAAATVSFTNTYEKSSADTEDGEDETPETTDETEETETGTTETTDEAEAETTEITDETGEAETGTPETTDITEEAETGIIQTEDATEETENSTDTITAVSETSDTTTNDDVYQGLQITLLCIVLAGIAFAAGCVKKMKLR